MNATWKRNLISGVQGLALGVFLAAVLDLPICDWRWWAGYGLLVAAFACQDVLGKRGAR